MARKATASIASSAQVERVRDRIEHWRMTRTKLWPMPEDLWREAISLGGRGSVFAVSRALGINYASLKRRVADAQKAARGRRRSNGFVELSGAALLGATGTVIELADGEGVRMTVRLGVGAGADLDVAKLVAAFRQRHE